MMFFLDAMLLYNFYIVQWLIIKSSKLNWHLGHTIGALWLFSGFSCLLLVVGLDIFTCK